MFRLEGDSPIDESQQSIETLTNNIGELDLILAIREEVVRWLRVPEASAAPLT